MSEERTQQATPKRRQEARRRGQVARSPDFTGAVAALGGLAGLAFYAPALYARLADVMRQDLGRLARPDLTQAEVANLGLTHLATLAIALMPIFLGLFLLGMAANVLQVGFLFTGQTLAPDFSRINPLKGLARLFSPTGLFELAKAALKALVIGYVGYSDLRANQTTLLSLAALDLHAGASTLAGLALGLALKMAGAAFVLAVVDYGIQRYRHERSLRMSQQEVKEELKQTEGNPQLKSYLRQLRRKLAQKRMMQAVPKADVVVTNPTHIAVALRYDAATMRSPQVVALGADYIAERIKAIAREHHIPLVENKPLARALYQTAEIGMEIPFELYQAVAEILAFVYALKERARGR